MPPVVAERPCGVTVQARPRAWSKDRGFHVQAARVEVMGTVVIVAAVGTGIKADRTRLWTTERPYLWEAPRIQRG
jgi:hypothetical protein